MNYFFEHVTAFRIPPASDEVADLSFEVPVEGQLTSCFVHVVRDAANLLLHADRALAIREGMLRGGSPVGSELDAEVQRVRGERTPGGTTIVVVIRGPATLNLGQIRRDFESFVVALVYADKQTYREQTREVRGAIGGALAMMCEPAGIQKLLDSVYFFDESDRPYYVYNLWGGGRVSAVAGWSPGQPEEFRALCLAAVATPEVRRSSQLMTMTLADGVERFQRFFLLWTGLEILTNKIFVRIVSLDGTKPIQVPDDVRGRVDAQKAKLQDKFTLLAAHVFPGEAAVDCKEFERLRKARDLLIHSGEGADRDLPVEEASRMLTKYLRGTAEVLGPVS